jgi:hypothetical protein
VTHPSSSFSEIATMRKYAFTTMLAAAPLIVVFYVLLILLSDAPSSKKARLHRHFRRRQATPSFTIHLLTVCDGSQRVHLAAKTPGVAKCNPSTLWVGDPKLSDHLQPSPAVRRHQQHFQRQQGNQCGDPVLTARKALCP